MVDNAAAVSALGLSPETTLVFCVVALLIVGAIVVIVASIPILTFILISTQVQE